MNDSESHAPNPTATEDRFPEFRIEPLWTETLGDPSIRVAVLDGPVDLSHPCFSGAALTQVGESSQQEADGPAARHGTHIASVIFGQHGSPVSGIAPRCTGILIQIFRDEMDESVSPCSQVELARGITAAVEAGAHVINVSGGQFEPSGSPNHFLARAVDLCRKQGVLIVAATGNEGCECLHIPAAMNSVLAVGASDVYGNPLPLSNWSSAYRTQGVLAPGESILGAVPGGGVASVTGTSVATPIVSGVAALLLSLQKKRGYKPSAGAVRSAILRSSSAAREQSLQQAQLLAGRLDVTGATILLLDKGGLMLSSTCPDLTIQAIDQGGVASSTEPTHSPAEIAVAERIEPTKKSEVVPFSCSCGSGIAGVTSKPDPQRVFAFGQLGFDFGSEARRDSIAQHMGGDPYNPELLLAHLENNPWDAAAINWTLSQDAVRIYAMSAGGAFASQVYERLREFLRGQVKEGIERIAVPGLIVGQTQLLTGEVVPLISPDLRGMYSWTTPALVRAVVGPPPAKAGKDRDNYEQKVEAVRNFLERVYHELRNLGVTGQERAINYAASNAFAAHQIFESALKDQMELDAIETERSPICRPDSDCWDVKLTFFNPARVLQQARKAYRFTVDVSDVVPVTVGLVRSWYLR